MFRLLFLNFSDKDTDTKFEKILSYHLLSQITAWVSNVDNLGFTFDIKKSSKQKILDEITSGRMKKEIQDGFKDIAVKHGVESYRDIKVKMIRIM